MVAGIADANQIAHGHPGAHEEFRFVVRVVHGGSGDDGEANVHQPKRTVNAHEDEGEGHRPNLKEQEVPVLRMQLAHLP